MLICGSISFVLSNKKHSYWWNGAMTIHVWNSINVRHYGCKAWKYKSIFSFVPFDMTFLRITWFYTVVCWNNNLDLGSIKHCSFVLLSVRGYGRQDYTHGNCLIVDLQKLWWGLIIKTEWINHKVFVVKG